MVRCNVRLMSTPIFPRRFSLRDGWSFIRVNDPNNGDVVVFVEHDGLIVLSLTAHEWASVVASMTFVGEDEGVWGPASASALRAIRPPKPKPDKRMVRKSPHRKCRHK